MIPLPGLFALSFVLAGGAALLLTPLVRRLALAARTVDEPSARRVHDRPTPSWGGLAIIGGFVVAVVGIGLTKHSALPDGLSRSQLVGLLLGGLFVAAIGVVDDRFHVRAKTKLAGQIIGAALLVPFGVTIQFVSNPFGGGMIALYPWAGAIFTVCWVVATTNAINLVDGLDGLAAGISVMAGFTLGVIAALRGQPGLAVVAFALSGAAAGFLPYNFHPARIFMGDTGAYFLGFALGAITLLGAFKVAASIAIFVPVLVLAFPLLDTVSTALRRYRRGQPVFGADREHLHHRLLAVGLSHRGAVLFTYFVTLVSCAVALWIARPR